MVKPINDAKWKAIQRAINAADPIGLINMGAPKDEYDVEVFEIYHSVDSEMKVPQIQVHCHRVFSHYFEKCAGTFHDYKKAAQLVHFHLNKV